MDLPKLNTFSPYQVNENEQTFVASWKSLDTSVVRSIIVYVGLEHDRARMVYAYGTSFYERTCFEICCF